MSNRPVLSPALWPFSAMGLTMARKFLSARAVLLVLCAVSFCSQAQDPIDEEEINRLLGQLSSLDEFEREETYAVLARIGEPAIPALIQAFESDYFPVRRGAIRALTQIGEPAIPALLEALASDSAQVRWTAAHPLIWETLGDSFKYADVISYTLLDALRDADPRVRRRAAQSLWEMTDESATPVAVRGNDAGPTVSALMAALQSPDIETRRSALESLSETIETQPLASRQGLVGVLMEALNDSEAAVRRIAAWTLGQIGERGQVAIPQLTKALEDPDAGVRSAAAVALATLGKPAEGAIPSLRPLLDGPAPLVRASAAIALATLGDHSQEVVLELRHTLKFPNEDVREDAASTLGLIGDPAKDAVPELTELLEDVFPEVRRAAAITLGEIGESAKDAVPQLIQALKDRDPVVRNFAARALGAMGAEVAAPDLRKALKDSNPSVRARAARSLGQIRYEADEAIPELSGALKDPSSLVRKFSAEALGKIAIGLQEEAVDLSDQELGGAISNLEAVEQSLTAAATADAENAADYKSALVTVRLSLDALRTQRYGYFYEILANKWLLFAANYLLVLPVLWWLLLWLRPLWLFHINHALEPYEFMAPRALGKNKFSTRYIVLVGFYYYHPRVLDAWVKARIATVRETFEYRVSVKSRQTQAPLPLALNGITLPKLAAADLRPTFSKQPSYLLIWGEGGSGKTHLAIQIAKSAMSANASERVSEQPMLPVLIDQNLDFEIAQGEQDVSVLTKAVRGQLQDLTRSSEPLSYGVVNAMLRERSLLVIVDGLSERSEATRDQIRPELPDFPANALIVTSRAEEPLGEVTKSTIKTLPMPGDQFPAFLEGYLSALGKSDLRQSSGYADACHQYTQIVDKHRVPVLLARMYADRAIAAMVNGGGGGELSGEGALVDDVSGLMLSFFNALNSEIAKQPEEGMDIQTVQEMSTAVAWECTKGSLRPQAAKRRDLLEALGREDAAGRLKYLERRLFLVEAVGVAQDRLRFTLELLADYLAAAYLVDSNGADEASWRDVLQRADEVGGPPEATLGFLRALEVCCREENRVPTFVADDLKERTEKSLTRLQESRAPEVSDA